MANLGIKVNLLGVRGAFTMDIKGNNTTKKCICIPIQDAGLYEGAKGTYLDLTAVEIKNPQYQDSHLVKQALSKEIYNNLDDEERRNIPILGGLRSYEDRKSRQEYENAGSNKINHVASNIENNDGGLPF